MPDAIQIPGSGEELLSDPAQLQKAYKALNSLLLAKRKLVKPQAAIQIAGQLAPLFTGNVDGSALLVQDPYLFDSAIANPTGGGTIDAEARTAISAILAQLRARGICPQ